MPFSVKEAFMLSCLVFFPVNFAENLVHYYIGVLSESKQPMKLPSKKDFVYIILTMVVFALVQGTLTYLVERLNLFNTQ